MAQLRKTLTSYNLHTYSIDLEKAIKDGWEIDKSVSARRSLGNKFSVLLVKETETAKTVEEESSTTDSKVIPSEENTPVEDVVEPKKTTRKTTAKSAKVTEGKEAE